ncbi:hypothetical protein BXZ70DRAFT_1010747 [Cristinia sonorae]|uniref:SnoaL-like domain-containing protein n=1 Tax=Cristinia sonorae TaxID=1940300 RepID=A0A8K0UIV5_9AGAR|nr:hypothetical protein BXZ70DRAFT_1010747 [Cristinia sonorae]
MSSVHPLPPQAEIARDPSPQLRAVLRWFDALVEHDVEMLKDVLTEDYVHPMHPRSLGLQTYDRVGFLEFARKILMPFLTKYEYSIIDVVETSDRVVVHTYANGTTSTGYSYSSELLLMAHVVLQLDGEYKIKTLKEFVDPGMIISGFFAEELKRVAELELSGDE